MAADVSQPHLQKMLDKSQERKRIFNDYLTNDQENTDTFADSDHSIDQLKVTDGLYKTETQKQPEHNEMEYFDAKRNEIYKKREEILSRKHVVKEEPKKVVKLQQQPPKDFIKKNMQELGKKDKKQDQIKGYLGAGSPPKIQKETVTPVRKTRQDRKKQQNDTLSEDQQLLY